MNTEQRGKVIKSKRAKYLVSLRFSFLFCSWFLLPFFFFWSDCCCWCCCRSYISLLVFSSNWTEKRKISTRYLHHFDVGIDVERKCCVVLCCSILFARTYSFLFYALSVFVGIWHVPIWYHERFIVWFHFTWLCVCVSSFLSSISIIIADVAAVVIVIGSVALH